MTSYLLLAQGASTLALFGLICFVQVVHYPLFDFANRTSFQAFAESHQRRTGFVVMPLMVTELASAALLAALPPEGASTLAAIGLALVAAIWLSTFLVQIPLHRILLTGYSRSAIQKLVLTNWIRTGAWGGRAAVAVTLIAREMPV